MEEWMWWTFILFFVFVTAVAIDHFLDSPLQCITQNVNVPTDGCD